MVLLTRIVRFSVNPAGPAPPTDPNSFAANPSPRGLARHVELVVQCRGNIHPVRSYLVDIKEIDRCVRQSALPLIDSACRDRPVTDPSAILRDVVGAIAGALRASELDGELHAVRWTLSPYYSLEMSHADRNTVLMRQVFDIAASHRLHVPTLSDEENRRLFGKCNNPSGHGHNYRIEPLVAVRLDARGVPSLSLQTLERIVDECLLRPYDHKHLNEDTVEFNVAKGGKVPSVENIARVFFERLAPALASASPGSELRSITVAETDRTSATYPA